MVAGVLTLNFSAIADEMDDLEKYSNSAQFELGLETGDCVPKLQMSVAKVDVLKRMVIARDQTILNLKKSLTSASAEKVKSAPIPQSCNDDEYLTKLKDLETENSQLSNRVVKITAELEALKAAGSQQSEDLVRFSKLTAEKTKLLEENKRLLANNTGAVADCPKVETSATAAEQATSVECASGAFPKPLKSLEVNDIQFQLISIKQEQNKDVKAVISAINLATDAVDIIAIGGPAPAAVDQSGNLAIARYSHGIEGVKVCNSGSHVSDAVDEKWCEEKFGKDMTAMQPGFPLRISITFKAKEAFSDEKATTIDLAMKFLVFRGNTYISTPIYLRGAIIN